MFDIMQEKYIAPASFTMQDLTYGGQLQNPVTLEDLQRLSGNTELIQNLYTLQNAYKLVKEHGANVTLAETVASRIPSFINKDIDLSMFTKDPTFVQQNYTLQAIDRYVQQVSQGYGFDNNVLCVME